MSSGLEVLATRASRLAGCFSFLIDASLTVDERLYVSYCVNYLSIRTDSACLLLALIEITVYIYILSWFRVICVSSPPFPASSSSRDLSLFSLPPLTYPLFALLAYCVPFHFRMIFGGAVSRFAVRMLLVLTRIYRIVYPLLS